MAMTDQNVSYMLDQIPVYFFGRERILILLKYILQVILSDENERWHISLYQLKQDSYAVH